MSIGAEEEIVRAICTDKWDGIRLSPSLFKGTNTSVSRLVLISLEDHWDLFRRHLEKPPERKLERIGQINVGRLQEIGRTYKDPVSITVEGSSIYHGRTGSGPVEPRSCYHSTEHHTWAGK